MLDRIKQAKKKIFGLGYKKFGNFFTEVDYQFYKAVFYFYDEKYEMAAKNFKRAYELM